MKYTPSQPVESFVVKQARLIGVTPEEFIEGLLLDAMARWQVENESGQNLFPVPMFMEIDGELVRGYDLFIELVRFHREEAATVSMLREKAMQLRLLHGDPGSELQLFRVFEKSDDGGSKARNDKRDD